MQSDGFVSRVREERKLKNSRLDRGRLEEMQSQRPGTKASSLFWVWLWLVVV